VLDSGFTLIKMAVGFHNYYDRGRMSEAACRITHPSHCLIPCKYLPSPISGERTDGGIPGRPVRGSRTNRRSQGHGWDAGND